MLGNRSSLWIRSSTQDGLQVETGMLGRRRGSLKKRRAEKYPAAKSLVSEGPRNRGPVTSGYMTSLVTLSVALGTLVRDLQPQISNTP